MQQQLAGLPTRHKDRDAGDHQVIARGMIFSGSGGLQPPSYQMSTAEYANTTRVTISSGGNLSEQPAMVVPQAIRCCGRLTVSPGQETFPPLGTPSAREP